MYAFPLHLLTTVVFVYSASDYSVLTLSPLCLPFLSTTPLLPHFFPKIHNLWLCFGNHWNLVESQGHTKRTSADSNGSSFPWISSRCLIGKWKGLLRTCCSHTSDCSEPLCECIPHHCECKVGICISAKIYCTFHWFYPLHCNLRALDCLVFMSRLESALICHFFSRSCVPTSFFFFLHDYPLLLFLRRVILQSYVNSCKRKTNIFKPTIRQPIKYNFYVKKGVKKFKYRYLDLRKILLNEVPFAVAYFQYCYDIEGPLCEQDEESDNIDD